VDAHRTLLLCASPWCKKDYVTHTNSSFPGLLKTIFRLLKMPPLNLFDAAASESERFFHFTSRLHAMEEGRVWTNESSIPRPSARNSV